MTGCNILNTDRDGKMPSEFTSDYHVHWTNRPANFGSSEKHFIIKKPER